MRVARRADNGLGKLPPPEAVSSSQPGTPSEICSAAQRVFTQRRRGPQRRSELPPGSRSVRQRTAPLHPQPQEVPLAVAQGSVHPGQFSTASAPPREIQFTNATAVPSEAAEPGVRISPPGLQRSRSCGCERVHERCMQLDPESLFSAPLRTSAPLRENSRSAAEHECPTVST